MLGVDVFRCFGLVSLFFLEDLVVFLPEDLIRVETTVFLASLELLGLRLLLLILSFVGLNSELEEKEKHTVDLFPNSDSDHPCRLLVDGLSVSKILLVSCCGLRRKDLSVANPTF